MTSGCCCRHLVHNIILTFCLSFAMGAGEATPSIQEFDFNVFVGARSSSLPLLRFFIIILGHSGVCSLLNLFHVMLYA